MSEYSDNETASSSDAESVEKEWKPDEEPNAKPKRKYVRKAQSKEQADAIKQKKIENKTAI